MHGFLGYRPVALTQFTLSIDLFLSFWDSPRYLLADREAHSHSSSEMAIQQSGIMDPFQFEIAHFLASKAKQVEATIIRWYRPMKIQAHAFSKLNNRTA